MICLYYYFFQVETGKISENQLVFLGSFLIKRRGRSEWASAKGFSMGADKGGNGPLKVKVKK